MVKIRTWVAGSSTPRNGFTILELMVVLVIATLIIGLVTPRLMSVLPGVELKTSAQQLAAALRQARNQAISSGKTVAVTYDKENPALLITGRHQPYSWPASIQLELQQSNELSRPIVMQQASLLFYPDGSSTGGSVLVSSETGKYKISVHWLTGRVSIND